MQRFCRQFYCEERGDRFCCADCRLQRDCANPCLNHPSRCRLVDPDGKPVKRKKDSNGRLLPRTKYRFQK